ncbi:GNAT family N-acetyltransferase [Glaciimonas sp. PCH181]|uniref:GNAT family N-acetyltransferase n=1 Tax=Glaciimonas sp. PCH181 TaxID=2133943 RepID=UPI000D331D71|nr:GNAT family N-acetyltransferase [Glaciimonas sp. PCH181]PUA18144.1 GNAT family N-acetyltransferase [Glaciimonas sp. PCH181]
MTSSSTNSPYSPAISVRLATIDDAAALVVLLAEMDEIEEIDALPPDAVRLTADGARQIMTRMADYPDFRVFLVLADDLVVGTFSLLIFSSLAHDGSQQAVLDAVVISRQCRGQGIGGVMLDHACKLADDAGCYKIALSSNLKRMDAHRFYETYGFAQHGVSFSLPL